MNDKDMLAWMQRVVEDLRKQQAGEGVEWDDETAREKARPAVNKLMKQMIAFWRKEADDGPCQG